MTRRGTAEGADCRGAVARRHAGRVVEVRVWRLASLGDIESLHAQVFAAIQHAGPGAIICADYRFASVVSREVAHAWARGMRTANRGIARSALLIDPANTMFNLQIERVVRCSLNPARQLFADVEALRGWVGLALPEPEREVLRGLFSRDDA